MIHDHMNIWLLRTGVGSFGDLPTVLEDTDKRGGADQFGERSGEPLGDAWRFEGAALHGASRAFDLLGAIWLRAANELVMGFEDGFVAIVQSDRFEVSWSRFEVAWIELSDNSRAHTGG